MEKTKNIIVLLGIVLALSSFNVCAMEQKKNSNEIVPPVTSQEIVSLKKDSDILQKKAECVNQAREPMGFDKKWLTTRYAKEILDLYGPFE